MNKASSLLSILIVYCLSSCKVSMDTPQYKSYPRIPDSFTVTSSNIATELPPFEVLFEDADLQRLIDTALVNNFDLKNFMYKVQIAKANARQERGNNLPNLNLAARGGIRKFGKYTIDGVGNFDTNLSENIDENQLTPDPFVPDYFGGLVSSWEVDLWGKLKAQRTAANTRLAAMEEERRLLQTMVVAEITQAYYELLILDNQLSIIFESIGLQEKAVEIISVMKQVGESNSLAVELSTAQLLASRALMLEVKQNIIEVENHLNLLVGRYPEPIYRGKEDWLNLEPPVFDEGVPIQFLNNRPDVRKARLDLIAADADAFAAKTMFLPSLTITADLGLNSFRALRFINPASLAMNAFGGLTLPLLNRRFLEANLDTRKAQQQIAFTSYHQSITKAFTEVYGNLKLLENTNDMFKVKQQEVNLLRQSVSTSTELFRYGRANYLEIVTAQRNALQAQVELVNLKKRQFDTAIDLYRTLGGGWKDFQ